MLPRLTRLTRTPRSLLATTALALVVGTLGTVGVAGPAASAPSTGKAVTAAAVVTPTAAAPARRKGPKQPHGPTVFQLSSFNLLGSGHTDGGPRKKFANSSVRMTLTKEVIDERGLDVIGFQEMHTKQVDMWTQRYSRGWGLYPGRQLPNPAGHNSITWRKGMFDLVKAKWLAMPYFNGDTYKMPYVQLRHRATKQLIWVSNVHLPANVHGNQTKYRVEGIKRQAALINRLRKQDPSVPVYLTGDMNDRAEFFCPMMKAAPVAAANGGYADTKTCTPPTGMNVDWIVGTKDASFTGFLALDDEKVDKASDHPFIIANAHIPSPKMRTSPIRNVVVVAVDGLRSDAVRSAETTPWFGRLQTKGSGTLNARTVPESTLPLPNLTSILTGRPVVAANGGHGVSTDTDSGGTVHDTAGRYVSSVFDLAHNNGLRTGFYTAQDRSAMLVRTWRDAGGRDPFGKDDGTDKFTTVPDLASDAAAVTALNNDLRTTTPPGLSVLELGGPEAAGLAHGFESPQYAAAVAQVDDLVGQVMRNTQHPRVKGKVLVIVVGTSGGAGTSMGNPSAYHHYRVPFFAWGPGVAAGRTTYSLNPEWRSPGARRGSYAAPYGPVLVASAANLALGALRLPAIPGSTINGSQKLSVWKP